MFFDDRKLVSDFGSNTPEIMKRCAHRKIDDIVVEENHTSILFDGMELVITDNGQSCCEQRYMSTDDDATYHVGSLFMGIALGSVEEDTGARPDVCGDGDAHDIQFLDIYTTLGVISIANHNEHNGYYGGFDIGLELRKR